MRISVNARTLERSRRALERGMTGDKRHGYFEAVAEARYVLRKVFRIVEERAKEAELDPLAHQALIQIYGSPDMRQRVKDVAARLDISPAFASSLIKQLVQSRHVTRSRGEDDQRAIQISMTKSGIDLLHKIDRSVQYHVDHFTRELSPEQRGAAVCILMFYVGLSIDLPLSPGKRAVRKPRASADR